MSNSHHAVSESMAAVRVKVKLRNPLDEYLVEQGQLDPNMVHVYETEALVDRRTVRSVLPMDVVQHLNLKISRQEVIRYADGRQELVSYSESVKIEVQGRETAVEPMVAGDEVVIGRVALELLDFVMDYENQRLIPNPAHPDYPMFRI